MALESATYIHDLSPSDPVHTDGLAQADSHLRLIKSVLQATFPNLTGPVTASQAELNACVGLTGTVASSLALLAPLASPTFTGTVTAPTINATTSLQKASLELLPSGVIVKWAGASTAIPTNYQLCDGTNGTPDLRDRFIVGAGDAYAVGVTGGANSPTGTTASAGSHSHTGATAASSALGMSGSADVQGSHSHGGATAAYSLTVNNLPSHNHTMSGFILDGNGGAGTTSLTAVGGAANYIAGSTTDGGIGCTDSAFTMGIFVDGAHSHNISVSNVPAHTHGISTDGAHTHTLTMDTRPPYYALCFIMKL